MSEEDKDMSNEIGFAEAMAELEGILRGIEDEETDIDALGKELGRAAELLEVCRAKIRRAETEVTQIVQGIQEASVSGEDEPSE